MTGSQYKEQKVEVKLTEVGEIVCAEEAIVAAPEGMPNNDEILHNDEIPHHDETPPALGPRYDILGLVGTGGMGTVW